MKIKHIKTPIAGLNLYLNKVVSDERGSYCDMAPGGTENELYADGIKHIHASIATKKFIPRGGHYHYKLKENFFTLSGTALWFFYDFDKNSPTFGESFAIILGHDKLGIDVDVPECTIYKNYAAQISISPSVYHVFWPLTDIETVVAGTGSLDFDAEDYERTKVEDVPGAIAAFEEVKNKILENEKQLSSIIIKDGEEVSTKTQLARKIKAIIPAAKNNQQRPFSHTINKHLIPLGGKPMIFYPIENLVNSGIDQIGIIISSHDALLKQVVGDGSRWGIEIEYIVQKELTGLGSAIMSARDYINNEPFILYLGDNIIKHNIAELVNRYFQEKLNALLMLTKVECPQRFGVPEIKDGQIVSVEERPMYPKSEFAVAGVYIYDKNAFLAMDSIKISDRGQYEISDIHNYYINSNLKLDYQEIDKWWKDRGKPEDLLEGNKFVLQNCVFEKKQDFMAGEIVGNAKVEGNVKVGKGTRIIGKTLIRGPVSIGEGCLIKDSYIGPYTSIGNVSELNGTEIEHSLVMDNVNIYTKEKIVNSVIGRNASIVSGAENLPRGRKVIIGENSVIGW
ncbi:glucose-1-phosphate thymidylyltransferase [Patescibacteria group bacterium]|nr:glucose-1-phosphate thymidylyltransferase [Patescibacteria group bacterium]